MKVLILGASGIIGQHMRLSIPTEVKATFHRRYADANHIGCELGNVEVRDMLDSVRPDVIVNLAGESRPDVVEEDPELHEWINFALPCALVLYPAYLVQVRPRLSSRRRTPVLRLQRTKACERSPGYPASDEYLHSRLGLSVRRSYRPHGTARQMVAIAADGDRTPLLARVGVPTRVIHGADDPLVPVAAAHDLAAKIAGAKVDVIEGMGHDLPAALWPRFVADIADAAGRA